MSDTDPFWRRLLRHDVALVVLAILAGVAGAVLAARYLGARTDAAEAALTSRYQTRQVVVAAVDLEAGAQLDVPQMAARAMPQEYLPADAVTTERAASLLGLRTRIAIRKGTPIVMAALDEYAGASHLASLLSSSERALTIPVDDVNSQAGALRAGDRVDLYFMRNASGDAALVPLLEQVEVLAAGSMLLGDAQGVQPGASRGYFGTVTLRVALADAPRVLLAQQAGQIAVLLRPVTDDVTGGGGGVRYGRELLQPARATSRESAPRVELLVGGNGAETPDRLLLPFTAAVRGSGEST